MFSTTQDTVYNMSKCLLTCEKIVESCPQNEEAIIKNYFCMFCKYYLVAGDEFRST